MPLHAMAVTLFVEKIPATSIICIVSPTDGAAGNVSVNAPAVELYEYIKSRNEKIRQR
jgi:hypothetical protein